MIRLSRKGWNNVLIFAVLIMILLFNSTHTILTGDEEGQNRAISLLPPDAVIMTLDFGSAKVERIGRGWRLQSDVSVPEAQLNQMVIQWQQSVMAPTTDMPQGQPLVAVVWLAGEAKGRVFQLFEHPNGTLIEQNQTYFLVEGVELPQLLPTGVL